MQKDNTFFFTTFLPIYNRYTAPIGASVETLIRLDYVTKLVGLRGWCTMRASTALHRLVLGASSTHIRTLKYFIFYILH